MNDQPLKHILRRIAGEAIPPEQIDLWPGVQEELHAAIKPRPTRRVARWALAGAVLLATVLIVTHPQNVVDVLRRVRGSLPVAVQPPLPQITETAVEAPTSPPTANETFTPAAADPTQASTGAYLEGIGFIKDPAHLRVLSASTIQAREGITVEVTQAVADADRTVIIYQAEGLSVRAANSQGESAATGSLLELRLPDGGRLKQTGGNGRGWGGGYEDTIEFPALPDDVNEVTLVIPRLRDMPAGVAPENWELPFRLQPAPASIALSPVYAVDNPEAPSSATGAASLPHNLRISLEKVVQAETGYLFTGKICSDDPALSWMEAVDLQITGADGQSVPAEAAPQNSVADTPGCRAWSLQTQTRAFPLPATIQASQVTLSLRTHFTFSLDLGPNPQLGQKFPLGLAFSLDGQELKVVQVEVKTDPRDAQHPSLEFTFQPQASFRFASLENQTSPQAGTSGAGGDETFSLLLHYPDGLPTGVQEMVINEVELLLPISWQITWQPPGAAQQLAAQQQEATPSPKGRACLTAESFKALPPAGSLPAGVSGRLLVSHLEPGQTMYSYSLIDLTSGKKQDLAMTGVWPALSPDGERVAYAHEDGIYIFQVASGQSQKIPGTTQDDWHPLWSPDGDWIAFQRFEENHHIWVTRPDGSGLQRVMSGVAAEMLAGWSPTGEAVIFSSQDANGTTYKSVNISSGAAVEVFHQPSTGKNSGLAPSPDGRWIALSEMVFGQPAYGIFLAQSTGAGWGYASRHLFASAGLNGISLPIWSPDGQWLIVNISQAVGDTDVFTPVLMQPETCHALRLDSLGGEVVGWAIGK